MIIAVASGKGGTGKTTVAVSLALSMAQEHTTSDGKNASANPEVWLLDCDVEEPNAGLFLAPAIHRRTTVHQMIPEVNADACTYCGRCAEVCRFHSIAVIGKKVLVFPQMCHGCGSCAANCPAGAIREVPRPLGVVESGEARGIRFVQGIMNVGEALAVPVIRSVRSELAGATQPYVAILDAPPGTSCPMVASLKSADIALLVTEPTPFGLHDLRIAVDVARNELGLPVAVVVNRDGVGDASVDRYCDEQGLPVVLRIPLERRIGVAYSDGQPLVDALPEYGPRLRALGATLAAMVKDQARATAQAAGTQGKERTAL